MALARGYITTLASRIKVQSGQPWCAVPPQSGAAGDDDRVNEAMLVSLIRGVSRLVRLAKPVGVG